MQPAAAPPISIRVRQLLTDRFFLARFGWAVFLAVFGLGLYTGTNWLVERHSHVVPVPSLYFRWERFIPFVPWMVIPYWTLDPLYFFGPFLCTSRSELLAHVKRMVLGFVICCSIFLLWPLKEAFTRPPVGGVSGLLFQMLSVVDRPFNMAPSLHIVEAALLWVIYVRHTRGPLRVFVQTWFVLIYVSTLTTFQHHVIDIVTGQAVAMLCFYIFPDELPDRGLDESYPPAPRNLKVAWRYAGGAGCFAALALLIGSWGLLLLWPAMTLGIIAGAYFSCDTRLFRKCGSASCRSARLVLFPYLLGDRIAYLGYSRAAPCVSQITPGLWIGRKLSYSEAIELISKGVQSVLDLSAECDETPVLAAVHYRSLPILDLTAPSVAQLRHAVAFIRSRLPAGGVYVHCTMGFSRSACVAAAYLLASGIAPTPADAVRQLQSARPQVRLNSVHLAVLEQFFLDYNASR